MDPHEEYFHHLAREEIQILALRQVLYNGSWDDLKKDLEARKEGKPYVFKLQTRIDEDLRSIQKLMAYEAEHRVNLGWFITPAILAGDERSA
jgi:hypothetical protein